MMISTFSSFLNVLACATCKGDPTHATTMAANGAILFMLAILVIVLGSFFSFIIYLARQEKGEPVPIPVENGTNPKNFDK